MLEHRRARRVCGALTALLLLLPAVPDAAEFAVPTAPPDAPDALRVLIWPGLLAGPGPEEGRAPWRPRPVVARAPDGPAGAAAIAREAGLDAVIWAEWDDGEVVLFLFRAEARRLIQARMGPGLTRGRPETIREAVRLRARFLLNAPAAAGQPWRAGPSIPPLPPVRPPLPPEVAEELVTPPPPPAPEAPPREIPIPPPGMPGWRPPADQPEVRILGRRGAVIPDSPYSATAEAAERDVLPTRATDDRAPGAWAPWWGWTGAAVRVSGDDAEPGAALGIGLALDPRWGAALAGEVYAFERHDVGDRTVGVTTVAAGLQVARALVVGAGRLVIRGGPRYETVHVDAAPDSDAARVHRGGAEVALDAAWPLAGPLELGAAVAGRTAWPEVDLTARGGADEVTIDRGALEGAVTLHLGWRVDPAEDSGVGPERE